MNTESGAEVTGEKTAPPALAPLERMSAAGSEIGHCFYYLSMPLDVLRDTLKDELEKISKNRPPSDGTENTLFLRRMVRGVAAYHDLLAGAGEQTDAPLQTDIGARDLALTRNWLTGDIMAALDVYAAASIELGVFAEKWPAELEKIAQYLQEAKLPTLTETINEQLEGRGISALIQDADLETGDALQEKAPTLLQSLDLGFLQVVAGHIMKPGSAAARFLLTPNEDPKKELERLNNRMLAQVQLTKVSIDHELAILTQPEEQRDRTLAAYRISEDGLEKNLLRNLNRSALQLMAQGNFSQGWYELIGRVANTDPALAAQAASAVFDRGTFPVLRASSDSLLRAVEVLQGCSTLLRVKGYFYDAAQAAANQVLVARAVLNDVSNEIAQEQLSGVMAAWEKSASEPGHEAAREAINEFRQSHVAVFTPPSPPVP